MSARKKKTDETYLQFATALEMIGACHAIDMSHYTFCFKHGLNEQDRSQLPMVEDLPLSSCVIRLQIATNRDGRGVVGYTYNGDHQVVDVKKVDDVTSTELELFRVLAASVKDLERRFQNQGRFSRKEGTPWGNKKRTQREWDDDPESANGKSKQNKLTNIRCHGCQEVGHFKRHCKQMEKEVRAMVAELLQEKSSQAENARPDTE
jgi:hypothetical protein